MEANALISDFKEKMKGLEEFSKKLETSLQDQLNKIRNLEADLEKKNNDFDSINKDCAEAQNELAIKEDFRRQLESVFKDGNQEGQRKVADIARGDFNTRKNWALESIDSGNIAMLKIVVGFGLDVNAKCIGRLNETFLHYGAESGNLDVVTTLGRLGAEVNSQNEVGQTPLHKAAYKGHVNVCEYLIKKGADVQAYDSDGYIPYHLAVKKGQLKVMKYFVLKGMSRNITTQSGVTSYDLAVDQSVRDYIYNNGHY